MFANNLQTDHELWSLIVEISSWLVVLLANNEFLLFSFKRRWILGYGTSESQN